MNYFKNITIILFLVLNFNVNAEDSIKQFITFNINKRNIGSLDNFYEKSGPLTNNRIYSASVLYNYQLSHIKKTAIIGCLGLNGRLLNVGYKKSSQVIKSIDEDFKTSSFLVGLQFGLSLEKKVYSFKKNTISFTAGINGTGIVFNTSSTNTFAYTMPNNNSGKDSVVIDFQQNRLFYINPYFQLRLISKVLERKLTYGVRYSFATELDKLNAYYSVYDTRLPGYYSFKGQFLDNRDQLEFFIGIIL